MASQSDNAALYEIAYQEAAHALLAQQTVIDSFRTRAGLLFSAAAVTTSFLGAQALSDGSSAFGWLALAGFVGVAITSLGVLWPRRWELSADPRNVIRAYAEAEPPISVDELRRDISLDMRDSFVENKRGLERLAVLIQVASVLLTVEVVFWVADIALT